MWRITSTNRFYTHTHTHAYICHSQSSYEDNSGCIYYSPPIQMLLKSTKPLVQTLILTKDYKLSHPREFTLLKYAYFVWEFFFKANHCSNITRHLWWHYCHWHNKHVLESHIWWAPFVAPQLSDNFQKQHFYCQTCFTVVGHWAQRGLLCRPILRKVNP